VAVDLNRYLVVDQGGGRYMSMAVPYDARRLSAIDRDGGVWTASSATYRITRLDSSGDTSLVLQADVEGIPLTSEEREQALSSFRAAGVDPILPEQKPVLAQVYADDLGRLWVERTREVEEQPRRLDVYDREGQLLGAVQLPHDVTGTLIVRGQRLYAVARDELDVPYVVRASVPAFDRR
jgi:sugar lactone lactonase YvrE